MKKISLKYILNFYAAKTLPIISLCLFIYQFFCNWYFYLEIPLAKNNIFFTITKNIYIFFYFMALLSFIMTYITDPGYVTEENNEKFIYLYKNTRKYSLKRARVYNKNHSFESDEDTNDDLGTDELSSNDEQNFKEAQWQNNLYINCKKYKNCLKFKVKQCRQCHIVKVSGIVHCSICHKCVYMKDHHCIWFNQCIGQFNLKYFILFLLYLLLCSYLSLMKGFYYLIIKNYMNIFAKYTIIKDVCLFIFLLLDTIYVIFTIKLLYDQYTNLDDFSIIYDYKNHDLIEMRNKYEMLCENFGGEFGIGWFLPLKAGGYYELIKNKKLLKIENLIDEGNDENKIKTE